jgi:hypothetical protein
MQLQNWTFRGLRCVLSLLPQHGDVRVRGARSRVVRGGLLFHVCLLHDASQLPYDVSPRAHGVLLLCGGVLLPFST